METIEPRATLLGQSGGYCRGGCSTGAQSGPEYILLDERSSTPCENVCGYAEITNAQDCKDSVAYVAAEIEAKAPGKKAAVFKSSGAMKKRIKGCFTYKTYKILFNTIDGKPGKKPFRKICKRAAGGCCGDGTCQDLYETATPATPSFGQLPSGTKEFCPADCHDGGSTLNEQHYELCGRVSRQAPLPNPSGPFGMCYRTTGSCPCEDWCDEEPREDLGGCPLDHCAWLETPTPMRTSMTTRATA